MKRGRRAHDARRVATQVAVTVAISFAGARLAWADARHILVLRSEGSVDDATRSKLDAEVLRLAKNLRGDVEAAEITLSDAAAAAGCVWSEPGCKDQVLSTMGVDELVATTASSADSDVKVSVWRVPRGAAAKEASATIASGASGQALETALSADIGPLFGLAAPRPADRTPDKAVPAADASPDRTPDASTSAADTSTVPPPDSIATGTSVPPPDTTSVPPPDKAVPPDTSTAPTGAHPEVTAAPNGQIGPAEGGRGRRTWEITGMAAGGALAITGVALWAAAGGVQGDINDAPTRTLKDIQHLRDLEAKGDTYTTAGNVLFATGVVVGGVSAYFFWRHRHRGSSHQAMLAPALLDHGGGVTLTIGGGP